jgi:hypothetical protein
LILRLTTPSSVIISPPAPARRASLRRGSTHRLHSPYADLGATLGSDSHEMAGSVTRTRKEDLEMARNQRGQLPVMPRKQEWRTDHADSGRQGYEWGWRLSFRAWLDASG